MSKLQTYLYNLRIFNLKIYTLFSKILFILLFIPNLPPILINARYKWNGKGKRWP